MISREVTSPLRSGSPLPPDLTMLGAFWGVLLDIGAVLDCDTPDVAKLSAIRGYLGERGPAAGDWPPLARMGPGATAEDAAAMIAAALRWRAGPATATLAELAGREITVTVTGEREAGGRYERSGLLMAGDLRCARVRLSLETAMVPPAAMARIRAGQPCGAVLGPYGLTRLRREASAAGGDFPVRAGAALALCGQPAGHASEDVTRELCEHVAAGA
jgi:hypothetical protein